MLQQKDNSVNSETIITIQRSKHDKENPYVMISKELLRDPELSPRDKGALCFLLSLPDNWQAHPRQIAQSLGISKNQVYSILKKLIVIGYASKEEIKSSKGQFSRIEYFFHEKKIPPPNKIKEKSTLSQNPYTENPYTEKGTLKNTDCSNEDISEEINIHPVVPQNSEPASPLVADAPGVCVSLIPDKPIEKPQKEKKKVEYSQAVKDFADQMVKVLMDNIPTYRPPANMNLFHEEVRIMLEVENQNPEEMIKYFTWACKDNVKKGDWDGWSCIVARNKIKRKETSPAHIFREHLTMICQKANSLPERKFSPCSDDAASLKKWEEASKRAL